MPRLPIVAAALMVFALPTLTVTSVAAERLLDRAASVLAGAAQSQSAGQTESSEIAEAFKEALRIGSEQVVGRLGGINGFNADPVAHIPLPEELDRVKSMLATVGMSGTMEELELRLNRAAEEATPIAKDLFFQAVSAMTFEDVLEIYRGPKDSATQYFQSKMTPSLRSQMNPIVEQSLSQVGAVQILDQVMSRYESIPFARNVDFDMTDYVVKQSMNGIFYYLAEEEAAIRDNPARQTTDLLKKVFGSGLSR